MSEIDGAPESETKPARKVTDVLGAIGLGLVSIGAGLVYVPAGVVVAGLSCMFVAWIAARVEASAP